MVGDHDRRDDLIAKVIAGTMTPSEAEVEVARLGLESIEYRPEPEKFDPMQEQFWTLPMAVAWIAYRTADAVRENWHDYRSECRHWVHDGQPRTPGRSGLDLFTFDLTNLNRMQTAEEQEPVKDRSFAMSVSQAKHALWQALRNSVFEVSGIELTTEKRESIDALRLQDLVLGERDCHDVLRSRAPIGIGPVRYTNITVPMGKVRHHWGEDKIGSDASDQASLRSGAPGRPTSMRLIEMEFRRRCEQSLIKKRLSEEAALLSLWLKNTHPAAPPASAKTIENNLRADHRSYMSTRN